jgi:deazaflavin-dependent oxidoreductase (nitroreductase family)
VTTTGAKSGKERAVMLVTPGDLQDNPVIVASNAGDDRNPSWYHNIVANPEVKIKYLCSGREENRRARVLTPTERAELWPQFKRDIAPYIGYEAKTDREIPLVVLEPM